MSRHMLKFLILAIFILSSTVTTVIKFQRNLVSAAELPSNMPAVFLDPPFVSASPGETFVLSVEVFNLTTAFWQTETPWSPGEDLGNWSNSPLYNYSLGSLFGLDIQLGWDETVLKFVSNVTKIPFEIHSDGILHQPIFRIMNEVNETHGFPYPQPQESRYWLSYTTLGLPFNGNGTALELTFEVLKEGASNLNITRSQLSAAEGGRIPHKTISSVFRSPGARTRLAAVQVGSIVDDEFFDPAIADEDVNVSIQVKNDGEVSDTYNLTLYYDDEQVQNGVWIGQTLDPTESAFYTYTLLAQDLVRGIHNFKADLSILHEGELVSDSEAKQFRVIDPPQLVIDGPTAAVSGQTVLFDASQSSHSDPDGHILSYVWDLFAPTETMARYSYEGVDFTHQFSNYARNGSWRIVLSVTDNFGLTYSESRPFSLPYKTEATLVIHAPYSVHNLDTGLNYTTIQQAIDAPETLDGHEIFVEEGTYWENVVINKSLSIIGEDRNTTIVDGYGAGTVVIIDANNVSLTGFTVQGSYLFSQTSGIYASQWTIGSNISHNIVTNNRNGIEFDYYCSNNTVSDNIVVSNEYDGIKFEYFAFNNTVRRNTVSMNEDGIIFWEGGGNNIIENNTVHSNRYAGIIHRKGDNIIVKGNWAHNNSLGISMDGCSNSLISHNNVTDNSGFSLLLSDGINNIVENNLILNGDDGIFISWECLNNTIIHNKIMHIARWGIAIDWYCSNNTIEKNTILDSTIGIYLYQTNNNTVLHNNVSMNGKGISIFGAGNNTLIGNTISSSDLDGITLITTSNNLLIQNNIVNNDMVGIKLITASNNLLIQNNIVNNTQQVSGNDLASRWDDGLEGNFWSNYSGVDLNHDGIGDSPHVLEYGNQDNYPLMGAFHSFNVSQDNNVNVISNSTIEDFTYFESNSTIRMHISNMTGNQTHGFVRICIPHLLMTEPYNITVNGVNPTYWNYTLNDNGTHRWIYFAYEHSTLEIVIIPEFPAFLILPLFMIATLLASIIYRRKMVKSTSPMLTCSVSCRVRQSTDEFTRQSFFHKS